MSTPEMISSDSVSNRVSMFETSLHQMTGKAQEDAAAAIKDSVSSRSPSQRSTSSLPLPPSKQIKTQQTTDDDLSPPLTIEDDDNIPTGNDVDDSNSSYNDEEAVLMHTMSDSDDDIPLDDLFSTAASLDIRLETGRALSASQQGRRKYDDDSDIDIEATAVNSTKKEEKEEVKDSVAAAIVGAAVAGAKNADGESVASDDISVGGGMLSKEDRAALLPTAGRISMLPYTVVKSTPPTTPPSKKTPYRKYLCWCILIVLILIIIIATSVSLYVKNSNGNDSNNNNNNNNNNGLPIQPPLPIQSPSISPTLPPIAPTALSSSPTFSPTKDTITTTTLEPSMAMAAATSGPSEGLVVDFDRTAIFLGQGDGDRFGSVISMSADGTFMTVLSNSLTSPVQAFQQRKGSPGDWFPILTLPVSNMSLSFGADIDTATTPDDKSPVVAISSTTQVEVYKLTDGAWIEFGQPLQWNSPTVSYTAMALSSDSSTLAAGYVNDAGDVISVDIYTYDVKSLTWIPLGDDPLQFYARTRTITAREGTILSMSLALSGDGKVLSVEEWAVASPFQVVVQNFELNDDEGTRNWSLMGTHLSVPFGPVSIALSDDGLRFAVACSTPGRSQVYNWNSKNNVWTPLGNSNDDDNFLPGGSSVALARDGSRILIGDASLNKAFLYDYSTDTDTWLLVTPFSAYDSTSSYGAAVMMDERGSTIGVGDPTATETNLGQVLLYGA
ncbi:hypothetical protein FRACYDRAFT_239897 [Fragilariopsis cylindrus CCMP1102]|uniref:Uncharacterized protein n=1 Tax=Fragilariopsis cylindrus CCMP1102 TaxID=635003 RepID=A0A1E7FAL6_9STRA|nr:hypothetical protein FRACYDRAFT_239897 [Fragilariopsis cylindrus CCMP1102]|eukprot:OEU15220.1 hypothetical protein FRACYDRAFT_239897 [Fragilariopsis cylindrus CCMP1102]